MGAKVIGHSMPSEATREKQELGASIDAIRRWTNKEFLDGAGRLVDAAFSIRLSSIASCLGECLNVISALADSNEIAPFRMIIEAEGILPVLIEEQAIRIGFYPLAANPLHWGHILVGLNAMATLRLDKVVFLIAGEDSRKSSMLSARTRHQLGRSVIDRFYPLFSYSSLALGTDLCGESNFERLLGLNSDQRLEAFYIAGTDHFHRTTDQGDPDTIQKLEWVAERQIKAGYTLHTISAVFIDREGAPIWQEPVPTTLRVRILPALPISFSSTAVRHALGKGAFHEALGSLPFSSLLEIEASHLYGGES